MAILENVITFVSGAASGLLGGFCGAWLQSRIEHTQKIRETVCSPLLNEISNSIEGTFPEESNWKDIQESSKVLLKSDSREQLENYSRNIDLLQTIDSELKQIEEQYLDMYDGKYTILRLDSPGDASIVVSSQPREDRRGNTFQTILFTEFIQTAPDFSQRADQGTQTETRSAVEEWVNSDECPYDGLETAWNQASANWEIDIPRLYEKDVPNRYLYNCMAKNRVESYAQSQASKCRNILSRIMNRRF